MRKLIDNSYLTLAARLLVGGVFVAFSFSKIIDPGSFAKSIWYYHMVPGYLINFMALILPWLEMLTGLGLIFGVLYRGSIAWVIIMLLVFIIALSTAVAQGLDISCGCYKSTTSSSGEVGEAIIHDIVLIALSIQLYFSRSNRWMAGK